MEKSGIAITFFNPFIFCFLLPKNLFITKNIIQISHKGYSWSSHSFKKTRVSRIKQIKLRDFIKKFPFFKVYIAKSCLIPIYELSLYEFKPLTTSKTFFVLIFIPIFGFWAFIPPRFYIRLKIWMKDPHVLKSKWFWSITLSRCV